MQAIFGTEALGPAEWLPVALAAPTVLLLDEVRKAGCDGATRPAPDHVRRDYRRR